PAKNSNATSTEPTTEKKARIGIGALSLQNEMPFKINRPTKTAVSDRPNICAVLYSLVPSTCAVARSFVVVMTSIPAFRFFVVSRGKLERAQAVAPAHVGRLQLSKGRANLYLGAIRRCENRAVTHGITDIDRVFRSNAAQRFSPVLSSKQNFFDDRADHHQPCAYLIAFVAPRTVTQSAGSYYFVIVVVIIRYKPTAAARWASLFIIRAYFNNAFT